MDVKDRPAILNQNQKRNHEEQRHQDDNGYQAKNNVHEPLQNQQTAQRSFPKQQPAPLSTAQTLNVRF
jgi:hypothetical protein